VAQDHVTLERFANYWNKDAIHFDKVEYRVLVDPLVRLANLKAGAIELAEYVVPTDAAAVKADPRLRLVVSDAQGYFGIVNNLANGPRADNPYGKNALVRQALDISLDRAAMVQVVFNGMYEPGVLPVTGGSPYFDDSVAVPQRDVAKAKALLKQAGVAAPVKLDMMVFNDPDVLQLAEVIQSMAAESGFEIKIQAMEFASTLSAGQRGEFQAYLIGRSGRADADGNTFQFLRGGQGNNYSH
jgi:peptide/nickel transport system substrate-binding protein